MKSSLKQDWLQALRSGRYKQTIGTLKARDNGKTAFCCLGVLCDQAGVKWDTLLGPVYNCVFGDCEGTELTAEGRKFLGLTSQQHRKLIEMNDDEHKSFKEIADYIEKHVKEQE